MSLRRYHLSVKADIRSEHEPQRIRARLESDTPQSYVADAVLGAIDGAVTTFAVIAGAEGADFSPTVALTLGFANLVADGFSMAVGVFSAARTEAQQLQRVVRVENEHIDKSPEGEKEEVRQIYRLKGFEGELLEQVVEVICADRQRWVTTMVQEEHNLSTDPPNPTASAIAVFLAFIASGSVPVLPYVFPSSDPTMIFSVSCALTVLLFFAVGALKGHIVAAPRGWVASGFETLIAGVAASALSYLTGYIIAEITSTDNNP